jgi:hypothetical protein
MPFCEFTVDRNLHEDREYLSYGRFVIEAESKRHDAVLALLTICDRRRIGVELGIIPNLDYALPTDTLYHLGTFASNQLDVPATPNFTSENGHSIWVIQDFKTHPL